MLVLWRYEEEEEEVDFDSEVGSSLTIPWTEGLTAVWVEEELALRAAGDECGA